MARRTRQSGARRTPQRSRSAVPARQRRPLYEFKPDPIDAGWLKKLYMTRLQRLTLLKWTLFALVCVVLLVIQDVILSQIHIFGATTDLAPAAILLICVLAGSEQGSLFVLIASTVYWFSGSAPGAYVIALMSFFGIGAALFRQTFWHRSLGSIWLCTAMAIVLYEMGVFLAGILLGLTQWIRVFRFLFTGVSSALLMIPLYPLVYKIGQIGGQTWKE